MASVTFKRGTKAEIESTQIQDGQLLMETDQLNNNKIYLDLPNGTRVPVGGSGAWVGTKEEFELAVEEGKIADGTQVIITDDYESGITASMTLYSNAQSGLVATNVQSAIDEVSAKIGQENISQVGNSVTSAINNLNSNFSNNIEKCSKILGFSQNKSLGQAVSEHINKLVPFGEGIIHGINIAGTPLNDTNDIIIKVININGNNWYRVVIYDCQSSSIHTITNIAGSWSNWITIS